MLSGMISDAYTHEMGPNETLKMQDTRNKKKTPAPEMPSLRDPVDPFTCDPSAASQIRAILMPIVPKIKGFFLPTLSRKKTMKIRLKMGPTML
jgi:hypothetical protein